MPQIVRYVVFEDGTTTAGGKLQASSKVDTCHGFPMIRDHDPVHCPACNTVGYVKCVAPTGRGPTRERNTAQDGDLCICDCNPPPRLVAAHKLFSVSYSTGHFHFGPDSAPLLEHLGLNPHDFVDTHVQTSPSSHDEQVHLIGSSSVAGIPFLIISAGKAKFGYSEESGVLPRIATSTTNHVYTVYWGDTALARHDTEI